jgi:hypothetical protein
MTTAITTTAKNEYNDRARLQDTYTIPQWMEVRQVSQSQVTQPKPNRKKCLQSLRHNLIDSEQVFSSQFFGIVKPKHSPIQFHYSCHKILW